jgi:transcriptional regulator GlxA family with amidase domain
VRVDPDRIFVKDGSVYTSAGVTAGIDLALALVAEDHGKALALDVARELVVFLHRPGGQSQFSSQLALQAADSEQLSELCGFIEEHLRGDLSVEVLAKRAGMSPRNFARRFTEQVKTTPAKYVLSARVGAARRRLQESAHGLSQIAADCGLGTPETLRRAFVQMLGTTPSEYRERFSTKGAGR